MHKEELRLNMDIAIGRAPPLSEGQMQGRLRKEAHHLVEEFRDHNKQVGAHCSHDRHRLVDALRMSNGLTW